MSVLEAASVTTTPARSLSQRMDALRAANRKRTHRARVKEALKARRVGLFDVIDDPLCDTMALRDVLMAMPGFGACKADGVMRHAMVSPGKSCAGLTLGQRQRLAEAFAYRHPHMAVVFRAPEAMA